MRLDELLALQNGEHHLQVLNRDLKEFAAAVADLQSKIRERQVEVQSLMNEFDSLWW
jgi:peptidoglycan hydrolase CwlO-like protein